MVDWVLLFLWDFFYCKVLSHKLMNKNKSHSCFKNNLPSRKTDMFSVKYANKEWLRLDDCFRTYICNLNI